MPNYNKIIVAGHLTRDIDLRYTTDGTAIAKSGIAVNHKYGDKTDVCFVDFTFFNKQAESLSNFDIKKGDPLLIEGRLKLDSWEKNGTKHYKHTISGLTFVLLGQKKESGQKTFNTKTKNAEDVDEDSIPF